MSGDRVRAKGIVVGIAFTVVVVISFVAWRSLATPKVSSETSATRSQKAPSPAPRPATGKPTTPVLGAGMAAFEFPFLGRVEAKVLDETVPVVNREAGPLERSFRVFRDHRGNFLRAEYAKPGSIEPNQSVKDWEELYEIGSERIMRLSPVVPTVDWKTVLRLVEQEVRMSDVFRLNITYVDHKLLENPVAPHFIVNIYGYDYIGLPYENPARDARVRFIFDRFGKFIRYDNCLY